jgi:hypothetical protein
VGEVVQFPTEEQRRKDRAMSTLKHALFVAAIIAAVMFANNATGQKLSTVLAA